MNANVLNSYAAQARQTSPILEVLSNPSRLEILLAIGSSEACVCHLETALGYRQAYISQHLMALRAADLLDSRKMGRFVYYSLKDQGILDMLRLAWQHVGGAGDFSYYQGGILKDCPCPHCASGWVELSSVVDVGRRPTSTTE
jgi:ArsR family transcriptional regulator